MDRGEVVQIIRATLDERRHSKTNNFMLADEITKRLEEANALNLSGGGLTPEQLKRAAYGAAHSLIRQAIDNGELPMADIAEFLPDGYDMQQPDWDDVQAALENIVMSDLWEEQAKLDA